jgi:hypothetical protein
VLSTDGNTITWTLTGQKDNGEAFSSTGTVKRIAGRSGFEGTWESTEVQLSFTEVDVAANGDDGITVALPEDGITRLSSTARNIRSMSRDSRPA